MDEVIAAPAVVVVACWPRFVVIATRVYILNLRIHPVRTVHVGYAIYAAVKVLVRSTYYMAHFITSKRVTRFHTRCCIGGRRSEGVGR